MRRAVHVCTAFMVVAPYVATADLIPVEPDDAGASSVFQAMLGAAAGDTVALRHGYFAVTDLEVKEGVSLLGGWNDEFTWRTPGATHVHANGQGQWRQAVQCTQGQTQLTIVDGIEFTGEDARGVLCVGSSPTITNNYFHDHNAAYDGGAILFQDGSSPLIEGNWFRNNRSGYGGAIRGAFGAGNSAVIRGNLIESNQANGIGSAIAVSHGSPLIENNVVRDNTGSTAIFVWLAGAGETPVIRGNLVVDNLGTSIFVNRSSAIVERNTVWGNEGHGLVVSSNIGPAPVVERNIFGATSTGHGVYCFEAEALLACNCVFWTAAAPYEGCEEDGDSIQLDPLFCSAHAGDYTLQSNSPCAGDNNPACGLVGREEVGCGVVSLELRTWSQTKALYR